MPGALLWWTDGGGELGGGGEEGSEEAKRGARRVSHWCESELDAADIDKDMEDSVKRRRAQHCRHRHVDFIVHFAYNNHASII